MSKRRPPGWSGRPASPLVSDCSIMPAVDTSALRPDVNGAPGPPSLPHDRRVRHADSGPAAPCAWLGTGLFPAMRRVRRAAPAALANLPFVVRSGVKLIDHYRASLEVRCCAWCPLPLPLHDGRPSRGRLGSLSVSDKGSYAEATLEADEPVYSRCGMLRHTASSFRRLRHREFRREIDGNADNADRMRWFHRGTSGVPVTGRGARGRGC